MEQRDANLLDQVITVVDDVLQVVLKEEDAIRKRRHDGGLVTLGKRCTVVEAEQLVIVDNLYDQEGVRMNYTMHIRYQDRYQRTDAGWRIRERLLALDFGHHAPVGENPAHQGG